jgi:hypothetical protein
MKNRPTQTRRRNLHQLISQAAAMTIGKYFARIKFPALKQGGPTETRTHRISRRTKAARSSIHRQNYLANRQIRKDQRPEPTKTQQTINAMTNWQRNKYANWKSANKNAPYHIIEAAAARIQQTQRRWREDLTAV